VLEKEPNYQVTLTVEGQTVTVSGKSILDALDTSDVELSGAAPDAPADIYGAGYKKLGQTTYPYRVGPGFGYPKITIYRGGLETSRWMKYTLAHESLHAARDSRRLDRYWHQHPDHTRAFNLTAADILRRLFPKENF
jgi:hypothetical protein